MGKEDDKKPAASPRDDEVRATFRKAWTEGMREVMRRTVAGTLFPRIKSIYDLTHL